MLRFSFIFTQLMNHTTLNKSADFNEIGAQMQILVPRTGTWQSIKFCKSNMAESRHIDNHFWLYIYDIYWPINTKFGMKKQNHTHTQVTWPKYQTKFLFVS